MNARHVFALVLIVGACSAAQRSAEQRVADAACAASEQIFDGGPEGVVVCAGLDAIETAINDVLPAPASGPTRAIAVKTAHDLTAAQRAQVSRLLASRGGKVLPRS